MNILYSPYFQTSSEALVNRLATKEPEAGIPAVLHGNLEATVLFNNLATIPTKTFQCPADDNERATRSLDLDRVMREQAPAGWNGSFDIQVANPPYVRHEKIQAIKPQLKQIYPEIYNGTSDLCCYFYARSLQLLKPGEMLAFISSNKWFRANYGQKLRQHIANTAQIHSITDFGELPVFKSTVSNH